MFGCIILSLFVRKYIWQNIDKMIYRHSYTLSQNITNKKEKPIQLKNIMIYYCKHQILFFMIVITKILIQFFFKLYKLFFVTTKCSIKKMTQLILLILKKFI